MCVCVCVCVWVWVCVSVCVCVCVCVCVYAIYIDAKLDLGAVDKTRFGCYVGSAFGGMARISEKSAFRDFAL